MIKRIFFCFRCGAWKAVRDFWPSAVTLTESHVYSSMTTTLCQAPMTRLWNFGTSPHHMNCWPLVKLDLFNFQQEKLIWRFVRINCSSLGYHLDLELTSHAKQSTDWLVVLGKGQHIIMWIVLKQSTAHLFYTLLWLKISYCSRVLGVWCTKEQHD